MKHCVYFSSLSCVMKSSLIFCSLTLPWFKCLSHLPKCLYPV